MARMDPDTHDLHLQVIVFGAATEDFLGALGHPDGIWRLGEFKGWKPVIRFDGFPADPWADPAAGDALEALIPRMDGLVLTDDFSTGKHYAGRAVEQLARTLRPGKIACPAVVFGGGALAQEWETLSAAKLVLATEPSAAHAQAAVRALAKEMLRHVHPR